MVSRQAVSMMKKASVVVVLPNTTRTILLLVFVLVLQQQHQPACAVRRILHRNDEDSYDYDGIIRHQDDQGPDGVFSIDEDADDDDDASFQAGGEETTEEEEQQEQPQRGRRRRRLDAPAVDVPADPADHLVTDLPLLDETEFPGRHWAGHLPADERGYKYFFYWLFEPDASKLPAGAAESEIPLLIWLNGGPGCSSMDGLFLENGPFRFVKDDGTGRYSLKPAAYSWHMSPAWTLYIDQPVGTGLSFTAAGEGSYPDTDEKVNIDFYVFLQSFFALHAEAFVTDNVVNRPFFFSGESHAGHYIPSMIHYILQQNDNAAESSKNNNIVIPVSGAAIGNGWFDPVYQYAAAEAAYGHGIIGLAQVAALAVKEKECREKLSAGKYRTDVCFSLLDDIVAESHGHDANYKVSQYDVRYTEQSHQKRSFPPGHKIVEHYLGGWTTTASDEYGTFEDAALTKDAVLAAIHATAATAARQRFKECTDPPYNALAHQDGLGVVDDIVAVLQHDSAVQLLFFNGLQDLICNHVGNERALENLPWKYRTEWITASRYAWTAASETTGQISGYMKEYRNLKFLKLLRAGHMVPLDVPAIALDMMSVFMYGNSFDHREQFINREVEDGSAQDCPVCPVCPEPAEQEDVVCEECPVCPELSDEDQDNTTLSATKLASNGAEQQNVGAFIISYAWLVAAAAFGAFLAIVCWRRRNGAGVGTGGSAVLQHSTIPQYSLELREQALSSSYTDRPVDFSEGNDDDDDDDDDDEEENNRGGLDNGMKAAATIGNGGVGRID